MLLSSSPKAFILDIVFFRSKISMWLSFMSSISLLRLSTSLTSLSIYSFVSSMFVLDFQSIFVMAALKSVRCF